MTAALAALVSAGGCTQGVSYIDDLEIETEVNPDLDFALYTRFEIVDPIEELYEEPPEELGDVNLGILAGIESEMTSAGLVRSDLDHQLRVSTYVTIEPTDEFQEGVFGYYWGYDFSWAMAREHERGVLVVDVVDIGDPLDADDDVLAYRAIARGIWGESVESLRLVVTYALDEMFADFPSE